MMPDDLPDATRARLDGAVKRLHDAANDPTYSTPRVRRADIFAVVESIDALRTERDKYQALWYETAKMVREERERQAQAAPVLGAAKVYEDRWENGTDPEVGDARTALFAAVAAWRAAREG